jgi:hypothetical protein
LWIKLPKNEPDEEDFETEDTQCCPTLHHHPTESDDYEDMYQDNDDDEDDEDSEDDDYGYFQTATSQKSYAATHRRKKGALNKKHHSNKPNYMMQKSVSLVKKGRNVDKACNHCKRSHLRCDEMRPCRRCITTGKTGCKDVQHKPRGRPKLHKK